MVFTSARKNLMHLLLTIEYFYMINPYNKMSRGVQRRTFKLD